MLPHVSPMVGRLVHRLVVMFHLEEGKLHFYAPFNGLSGHYSIKTTSEINKSPVFQMN